MVFWIKDGRLDAVSTFVINCSYTEALNEFVKVWGLLDFLDDIKFIAIINVEFRFHLEDFIFEKAADLFVFRVVNSEEPAFYL